MLRTLEGCEILVQGRWNPPQELGDPGHHEWHPCGVPAKMLIISLHGEWVGKEHAACRMHGDFALQHFPDDFALKEQKDVA